MQTDNEVLQLKRKNSVLKALLIIVIIIAIIVIPIKYIKSYGRLSTPDMVGTTPSAVVASNSGDNTKTDALYVTFPGYGTTYKVNAKRKSVPLINYDTNNVNVIYELSYDDKVILTTDLLLPGESLDANLYDYFKDPGEYDVGVKAYVQTPSGGNGSTANFKLHVVLEGGNKNEKTN